MLNTLRGNGFDCLLTLISIKMEHPRPLQVCTNVCIIFAHTGAGVIMFLKGQTNDIFNHQFFHSFRFSFKPAWAANQWVKIFSILVKISPGYSIFSESPRGIIPQRFNLPGISYAGESISLVSKSSRGSYCPFKPSLHPVLKP